MNKSKSLNCPLCQVPMVVKFDGAMEEDRVQKYPTRKSKVACPQCGNSIKEALEVRASRNPYDNMRQ